MSISYDVAIAAVENDNLELLMLNIHIDDNALNLVGNSGDNTLLHMAVRNKRMKSVKWLVSKGVNLEPVNQSGQTPLMMACSNRDYQMVRYLGSIGLDLNSYNQNGLTMVHQCLANRDIDGLNELFRIPGVKIDKPTRDGLPTSYYLLSNDKLSTQDKAYLISKLIKIDFDFQLDTPIGGRKFKILEGLTSIISQRLTREKAKDLIKQILGKTNSEWLKGRNSKGRNLLMQWYLKGRSSISIVGTVLFESGMFDLNEGDNQGDNLIQIVAKNRPALLNDLLRITLKNQKYHHLFDQEIFLISLKMFGSEILSLMIENKIKLDRLIKGNPKIGCCHLLNWAIEKQYSHLVKLILKNESLSASDLINQTCLGTTKRERIKISGCSCGSCRETTYKSVEHHIPGHQPVLWTIFSRVIEKPSSSDSMGKVSWRQLLEMVLDILVKTGVDRESLEIPREYSRFIVGKNGRLNYKFELFLKRNLLNTNLITLGNPQNIYRFSARSDQKKVCLEDKLNINSVELSTNQPVDQIPEQHFILLSNGIAWDARNLFKYIQENKINSYPHEATELSPVFQGPIWSDFDLEKFKLYDDSDQLFKFLNEFQKAFTENEEITEQIVQKEPSGLMTDLFADLDSFEESSSSLEDQ